MFGIFITLIVIAAIANSIRKAGDVIGTYNQYKEEKYVQEKEKNHIS